MDLQIRSQTSRLDLILDILSTDNTVYLIYSSTIARVFIDPVVFYYFIVFTVSLLSFRTSCSCYYHSFVLEYYCSTLDTPFVTYVAQRSFVPSCRTIAPLCISRVTCTLWSHSSSSLTVVPGQFILPLITVLLHSLWYQPASLASCAYHPLRFTLTLLAQPCDLP